jgi:membrane protease YdiL (CAAX protease family)
VSSYISLNKNSISFPGIENIAYFTLVMLLVGIFEEVMYRGIILNSMLNKWGFTKAGIIKSVLLSSLIFGLGHLVNLLGHSTPIRTMTQVIYTFLNGILFASIYLRCKNIWAVAILHAVYDWLALVPGIFVPVAAPAAQVDTSISSMLVTGALYIPFALVGFFLLRKVFVEDKPKSILDTKFLSSPNTNKREV